MSLNPNHGDRNFDYIPDDKPLTCYDCGQPIEDETTAKTDWYGRTHGPCCVDDECEPRFDGRFDDDDPRSVTGGRVPEKGGGTNPMSFLDKRFARDFAARYNAADERAEDAADKRQAASDAEVHAELAKRTPAELQAEANLTEERRQILKSYPIGTTWEQAQRRGWVQ